MMGYDVDKIRAEFPAIGRSWQGRPLVYLDSACVTAICRPAIEAQLRYYQEFPGCVGRSAHRFGVLATEAWNEARETVRKFLNAQSPSEIIFTKNTTEAINLVANSFPLEPGDAVLITDLEHNSNLLPWLRLQEKSGIRVLVADTRPDTTFDFDGFASYLAKDRIRVVSTLHKSNLTGVEFPVRRITEEAHRHGAVVLVDAAQSPLTSKVDVREWDCDFLALSSHKVIGPAGVGVLYGKLALLKKMDNFLIGGGTVVDASYEQGPEFAECPARFEAGLQNCPGVMGLAAALGVVESLGQESINSHIRSLNEFTTDRLVRIPGVHIVGPQQAAQRGSILSFRVDGMSGGEVGQRLNDAANVMVRAGKHCVNAWFDKTGADEVVRASFGPYTTLQECEAFCTAVEAIARSRG